LSVITENVKQGIRFTLQDFIAIPWNETETVLDSKASQSHSAMKYTDWQNNK